MLVNLIWGAGFVVVDDVIKVMPVYTFNALRFTLAALTLLPLLFINTKQVHNQESAQGSIPKLLKTGFGLGFLLFLGFTLQALGLLYTSVSNTGFITGLCVPMVPVIGFLLFRTKVGREVWISVVIATIGIYLLTMGDKMTLNIGDVLVALGALCYACHISLMDKYGDGFPVVKLSIVQLSAVACFSIIAALINGFVDTQSSYPPISEQLSNVRVVAGIFYSAVLGSAFAYWAQTASQRIIEPHKIALIFATEPVFAHITAYFALGEHLGFQGWVGAALIIIGMLYSELGGKRKAKLQPLDQMASPSE